MTEVVDEGLGGEWLPQAVGRQAILSEGEVKEGGDWDGGTAELLFLLDEVGAADLVSVSVRG